MSGLSLAPSPVKAPSAPDLTNFNAALAELKMTPQEQALYMRHLGNVTGPGGVDNDDGKRSTLFAITREIDGRTYVLPTVYDGKKLDPDAATDLAIKEGLDKFPSYPTNDEAQARYDALHKFMEKDAVDAAFASGFKGERP